MTSMSLHQPITAAISYAWEYRRAYDSVMKAHRAGYHEPYRNLHSNAHEWQGYDDGFHDAVEALAAQASVS